jgi:NADH-quinone oxidoreductase subunit N
LDWSALYSSSLLAVGILAVLFGDLLVRGRRPGVGVGLAVASLAAAAAAALLVPRSDAVVLGVLRFDDFAAVFTAFCCAAGAVSVLATTRGEAFRSPGGEYLVLILSAVLGMSILSAAVDMATLYLAFETVSIPAYVLVGMRRADRRANEASLKYVLFGAVSSGLMLYGLSLLVGLAGGTSLERLAEAVRGGASSQPAFVAAVLLVFAGFAFKVSAVPFHFWAPDVYAGAPAAVGGFLAVASKAAGFAGLIRVIGGLEVRVAPAGDAMTSFLPAEGIVPALLAVAAVVTMTVGNLGALRQGEIKRLLAWSSIAHAGYLLLALAVGSAGGVAALVLYLVAYLFTNLAAFLLAGLAIRVLGSGELSAFRGLARRAPWLAFGFVLVLFSLTGIPPLFGFVAKLVVFWAVFEQGYAWLGVIGLLNGAVSLYYYARVLASMYLTAPEEAEGAPRLSFARGDFVLAALLVVPLLVFGLWWGPIWEWARAAVPAFLGAGG